MDGIANLISCLLQALDAVFLTGHPSPWSPVLNGVLTCETVN